jgi:hypothetical protein
MYLCKSDEKTRQLLVMSLKNVIASLNAQSNWQSNAMIEEKIV